MKNLKRNVEKSIDLFYQDRFVESANLLKKQLPGLRDPEALSTIYYNLGLCNYSLLKYEASEKNFIKSLDFGGTCQWELFLSLAQSKKIEESKKFWRYRCEGKRKSYPDLPIKRLRKLEVGGKLLVLNEQGFGDEIMFARQIKKLSQSFDEVYYQVYQETLPFFIFYHRYDNVYFFTERTLDSEFVLSKDYFCLSGDFFLDLMQEDYLLQNHQSIEEEWDIGFCWEANSKSPNTKDRSIQGNNFSDMFSGKKVLSLQWGKKLEFTDYIESDNFLETSLKILRCKEVWTVDTSIAHLALVLGKKVTLIYKDYLDWRWKYPIYQNFTLFKVNI